MFKIDKLFIKIPKGSLIIVFIISVLITLIIYFTFLKNYKLNSSLKQ